jgi:hypothetical protein
MLSETGTRDVFNSEMIIDYVTDGIINEMNGSLTGIDTREQFNDIIKSITNQENPKEAVRSMVVKNLDLKEMSNYVEELFKPKYSSFKERFYNEMVENIKDVPSMKDYPTILTETNAFTITGFLAEKYVDRLNIAPKYANLYDKFKFNGYSDKLIEKKINSGHFWVEKFYRIKDFESFREKYNNHQQIINDELAEVLFTTEQSRELPVLGDFFEEYISELDMNILLFGSRGNEDRSPYYKDGSQITLK